MFFGTSVFQEVVSKARFEDQEVSCEVPSEAKLLSNEVEEQMGSVWNPKAVSCGPQGEGRMQRFA